MPIVVRGITLGLDEPEELLPVKAAARLKVPVEAIRVWAVVRRAIDARDKQNLRLTCNLELALTDPQRREARIVQRLHRHDVAMLTTEALPRLEPGSEPLPGPPVVVGFGPAGMFAALLLARMGYCPVVLERGRDVSTRHRDIMVDYYRHGRFHPESNLLFGEGGAGAYSDGKLYTRVHDPRTQDVLATFYRYGASPSVLIDGKPHVGSDKLPGICRRIRLEIEKLGGQVRFGTRLDDLVIDEGRLSACVIDGRRTTCGPLILAIGHSARDTHRMLRDRGVACSCKPFQIGVRIEHPQALVDRWQYGQACSSGRLPPADYHLVAKGANAPHGDVFSFCMCPGGSILPTNESPGLISTNGASRSRRGGPLANSGLVISLDPRELGPDVEGDPVQAFAHIEAIERQAFEATDASYRVPAQRAVDLLADRGSDGDLCTSFPLGGQWTRLQQVLPARILDPIIRAIRQLDARLPGFGGPEALVTAPETRASGPVRFNRDPQTRQSISTANLYPTGEGAGYAGGIVSAAIDGIKSAECIIARYAPAVR